MIYVINLPARSDRKREMAGQLARVGAAFGDPNVTLWTATRPTDAGDFPSVGARGCFLSHLAVLRDACDRAFERILILEDDADFAKPFMAANGAQWREFEELQWQMAYFGYRTERRELLVPAGSIFAVADPILELGTTHAVLFRRDAIARAASYLKAMLQRPAGDPAGGPMHVDGAYNWFRRDNPDLRTVATLDQWAEQRSSRTDIAASGWKDRMPLVATMRRLRNRWRSL